MTPTAAWGDVRPGGCPAPVVGSRADFPSRAFPGTGSCSVRTLSQLTRDAWRWSSAIRSSIFSSMIGSWIKYLPSTRPRPGVRQLD
jgi:hypothetical protein